MATLGLAGEERDEAVRLRRGRRGRGRQARHWRRAPWSRCSGDGNGRWGGGVQIGMEGSGGSGVGGGLGFGRPHGL